MSLRVIIIAYGAIGVAAAYFIVQIARAKLGYRDWDLALLFFLSVVFWPLILPAIAIVGWSRDKERKKKEEEENG